MDIRGYHVARILLGKNNRDGLGDLQAKGIGFESWLNDERNGFFGVAHNGENLTRVRLQDFVSGQHVRVAAVSVGDGRVSRYVNDELRATTELGPTGGPMRLDDTNLQLEVQTFDDMVPHFSTALSVNGLKVNAVP